MSWGISPNAKEKEKIFADFNDSLQGMNSADGLRYRHYSAIYDIGRKLADKEYEQGRADAIDDFLDWLLKNYCIKDNHMWDMEKEEILKEFKEQKNE